MFRNASSAGAPPSGRATFGIPKRYLNLLALLSIIILISLFSTPKTRSLVSPSTESRIHPVNWFPDSISNNFGFSLGDSPEEWDEFGRCLFISPFDALSKHEKQRAEQVELEQVSDGIVRAKQAVFHPPLTHSDRNSTSSANSLKPASESLTNPILGLLRDGERKWKDMVAKQSKSLEEAVEEYKTRWNRNPPLGFDQWWQFISDRSVLLPDEYDAILNALLPFYAFSPAELAKRNAEAEKVVETFTLIVQNGKVVLQWNDDYSRDKWWSSRPRADAQVNLMEPFLGMLNDFRATFTIHDQPSILPDHDRMKDLTTLAKKKQVTNKVDEKDKAEMNWLAACAKDSPAVKGHVEEAATDTFVSSHASAMDFCQHPSILKNHGIALEVKGPESQPKPHTRLLPIFVPSRTALHADIPITPVGKDGRRDDVGDDPVWKAKSGKLYWRGLATGIMHNKKGGAKWLDSHRERLHKFANDVSFERKPVLMPIGTSGQAEIQNISGSTLSEYYMDVAMSGGPWQCDWGDGTCDEMKENFNFAPQDSPERSNAFKFVFDTDGNSWSSRFPRLMAARNVVIKATIFPEWNTHQLPEWYAYVPTKMDYSDLWSILAFFRGSPKGKGGHDEVARRIASNGQCWVERTWRREDMQAYMFRMYLEYARLMSPDRDTGKMDFILPSRDKPVPGETKPLPLENAADKLAEAEALPIPA